MPTRIPPELPSEGLKIQLEMEVLIKLRVLEGRDSNLVS
jgi:hypothetical protein